MLKIISDSFKNTIKIYILEAKKFTFALNLKLKEK
jgi:hypothetical protein